MHSSYCNITSVSDEKHVNDYQHFQLIDKNINWFKFSLGTIFNDMFSWPHKLGLKMHCQTFFWSAQRRSMVIPFLFGYTCKNKIDLFKQFFLQTYVDGVSHWLRSYTGNYGMARCIFFSTYELCRTMYTM